MAKQRGFTPAEQAAWDKMSQKERAALSKALARNQPRSGLTQLQKFGGRPVNRQARSGR